MKLSNHIHLTYCTNIHAGETWDELFKSLQQYLPAIKKRVCPDHRFGIGLRLSNVASLALSHPQTLNNFKSWLDENEFYVFTMNGFPYGGFHGKVVKDAVYAPDWTTPERLEYTKRLFTILAELLPEEIDGGVSTSPLSYKPWFNHDVKKIEDATNRSIENIVHIVEFLSAMFLKTGKTLHLDIEPEPDGLLENAKEVEELFLNKLLPLAQRHFSSTCGLSANDSEKLVKEHIRVCYDVCHHAVMYDTSKETFGMYRNAGIKIGKIQISAALRVVVPPETESRKIVAEELSRFTESTYLHQAVARTRENVLKQYSDLDKALEDIYSSDGCELRTHFHVPIYMKNYGRLESTQDEILKVLEIVARDSPTSHLEIETYTWDVLPSSERKELTESIIRELEWVIQHMKVN